MLGKLPKRGIHNSNKSGKIINTYLQSIDYPFMTNAGWPGTVIKDMTRVAEKNGAKVEDAHEFKFNTHNDGTTTCMATSEAELDKWVNSLK